MRTLKRLLPSVIIATTAIGLFSACSLQKPTKNNSNPDVVVVNAPSGEVLTSDEITLSYKSDDAIKLNRYRVILSWPKKKAELTLSLVTDSEIPPEKILFDAELRQQTSFMCDGGKKSVLSVTSVSKESNKNSTFNILVSCPLDYALNDSIAPTDRDFAVRLTKLRQVDGRLEINNGVTIDLGASSLEIAAETLVIHPQATIIARRTRTKNLGDSKFLPRSLLDPRSSHPENLSLKSGGLPLLEALTSNTKIDPETRAALSQIYALGELDAISAKNWLIEQDRKSPQIKVRAKSATGSLRLYLIGEDGEDGLSGDELARFSKSYQSLLSQNKILDAKPGAPGKSHQVCRKQPDGQYCEDKCIQAPTNGSPGSDALIPGLDGQIGTDGMPTPSAELKIDLPVHFNVIANFQPGHGGRTGSAGKGQRGGSGGTPGSSPVSCPSASIGRQGKSAADGQTPSIDAAHGWCSPIRINQALQQTTSTQTTLKADDLCREQRNELIQVK